MILRYNRLPRIASVRYKISAPQAKHNSKIQFTFECNSVWGFIPIDWHTVEFGSFTNLCGRGVASLNIDPSISSCGWSKSRLWDYTKVWAAASPWVFSTNTPAKRGEYGKSHRLSVDIIWLIDNDDDWLIAKYFFSCIYFTTTVGE